MHFANPLYNTLNTSSRRASIDSVIELKSGPFSTTPSWYWLCIESVKTCNSFFIRFSNVSDPLDGITYNPWSENKDSKSLHNSTLGEFLGNAAKALHKYVCSDSCRDNPLICTCSFSSPVETSATPKVVLGPEEKLSNCENYKSNWEAGKIAIDGLSCLTIIKWCVTLVFVRHEKRELVHRFSTQVTIHMMHHHTAQTRQDRVQKPFHGLHKHEQYAIARDVSIAYKAQ